MVGERPWLNISSLSVRDSEKTETPGDNNIIPSRIENMLCIFILINEPCRANYFKLDQE